MTCFYIAGPMRGIIGFNFKAFDAVRDELLARGAMVISPADLNRESGFDETRIRDVEYIESIKRPYIRRDILNIIDKCNGIVFLPGWEKSLGCAVEYSIAKFLNISIYRADFGGNNEVLLSKME